MKMRKEFEWTMTDHWKVIKVQVLISELLRYHKARYEKGSLPQINRLFR